MSESVRKRFPIVLTICVAASLAILIGLGTWQLERLQWKTQLLAHVEALKTAEAVPLAPVLARAKAGEDVAWTRVSVDCVPTPPDALAADHIRNAVRDGEIVWRIASTCMLPAGAAYQAIFVDRGVIDGATGAVEKPALELPALASVTGVLTPLGDLSKDAINARPVGSPELMLMVERETAAPVGVTPAPLPPELPNRHLEYALTWYGLAAALVGVYLALLRRRLKS